LGLAALAAFAPYAGGPPPAHTGGFGEPTCEQCHFGNPLNDSAGSFTVPGFPAEYVPGQRYRLVVRVARAGMGTGGFELSTRFASGPNAGRQAGLLTGSTAAVRVSDTSGVSYAHHARATRPLPGTGAVEWAVEWRAPDAGAVQLHAAANAANDDNSELGDHIYTIVLPSAAR
jgi:hypothetical protein